MLQIVVALLEPLQEGGALTVAASKALEELIIKGRSLLQAKLKGLPPLPQSIQVVLSLLPGMEWDILPLQLVGQGQSRAPPQLQRDTLMGHSAEPHNQMLACLRTVCALRRVSRCTTRAAC